MLTTMIKLLHQIGFSVTEAQRQIERCVNVEYHCVPVGEHEASNATLTFVTGDSYRVMVVTKFTNKENSNVL